VFVQYLNRVCTNLLWRSLTPKKQELNSFLKEAFCRTNVELKEDYISESEWRNITKVKNDIRLLVAA
jgi:lipoate-protein ligase A